MLFKAALSLSAAMVCTTAEAIDNVAINGEVLPYEQWHHSVLPGEPLSVTMPFGWEVNLQDESAEGVATAPEEPGHYPLRIRDEAGSLRYEISLFVLEPATRISNGGYLNGYRIGKYPRNRPAGFIRLDAGDEDIPLSPSFNLGQFLCKQQPGHFPKYLLVSKPNLVRLEALLEALREDNLTDADTFFVMSGFRTPFYNTAIGSAKFSRHMYGDAADIYLDVAPANGVMDDINGDGKVTKADATFLYDYASKLYANTEGVSAGGIGAYGANSMRGPFVHIDGRGSVARWGR
jgi:hypothetical protein